YGVGAATLFALRSTRAKSQAAAQSRTWLSVLVPPIMVSIGLLVSNIFFLHALPFMPAAEANLIVYLWPLMIILIAAPFRLLKIRPLHLLSIGLGLAGAVLIIGPGSMGSSWVGIGLAAASGFSWAIFCVYRLWQGADAPDALAAGLALSCLISLALHMAVEQSVMPSSAALLSAVLNGAVPLALGNLAWDYGLRRGNRALLAVFAYATPLVSAVILVAFGFAVPTIGLLLGGGLIVAASLISARA
ncbi:DMT family transporter, partial [Rhizobiaceae sp. 2RAB30]